MILSPLCASLKVCACARPRRAVVNLTREKRKRTSTGWQSIQIRAFCLKNRSGMNLDSEVHQVAKQKPLRRHHNVLLSRDLLFGPQDKSELVIRRAVVTLPCPSERASASSTKRSPFQPLFIFLLPLTTLSFRKPNGPRRTTNIQPCSR